MDNIFNNNTLRLKETKFRYLTKEGLKESFKKPNKNDYGILLEIYCNPSEGEKNKIVDIDFNEEYSKENDFLYGITPNNSDWNFYKIFIKAFQQTKPDKEMFYTDTKNNKIEDIFKGTRICYTSFKPEPETFRIYKTSNTDKYTINRTYQTSCLKLAEKIFELKETTKVCIINGLLIPNKILCKEHYVITIDDMVYTYIDKDEAFQKYNGAKSFTNKYIRIININEVRIINSEINTKSSKPKPTIESLEQKIIELTKELKKEKIIIL